jgi:hypothetical protein
LPFAAATKYMGPPELIILPITFHLPCKVVLALGWLVASFLQADMLSIMAANRKQAKSFMSVFFDANTLANKKMRQIGTKFLFQRAMMQRCQMPFLLLLLFVSTDRNLCQKTNFQPLISAHKSLPLRL